ncbi:hypothetical protein AC579_8597 [Pseudocercospora musae]|uniref:Uncharacterized protein n=1 Tax=Pseudocercospora musae TaxID=113226 RepID=A0A139I001_9PEZI|nr:hypothetical protein AC579_8597 [Pseudocercospora musae]
MDSTTTHNGFSSATTDSHTLHGQRDFGDITPEKLAIMKLRSSEYDDDIFSDPGTPSAGIGKMHSSRSVAGGRSSLARTSRQVSSSARRQSNFMHSHRSKMSMELTGQAETKFFSLIELMSNASREASSLKEYWSRLMSDRESFDREREELMLQIEEINETLEQKETQHHHHGRELGERRKEVEKLLIELSAALNSVSEQKRKVADREHELDTVRKELSEVRITSSRLQIDFDKGKSDHQGILDKLRNLESERDHHREESEKHRSELRIITRDQTDIKSKNTDLLSKLESARKEIHNLTDRIKSWERERDSYLIEKDRLHEEVTKHTTKSEEISRELSELVERYERLQRENRQTRESIRIVEGERDDHHSTIERLRAEIRGKTTSIEEVENRLADIVLKHEHSKREVSGKDDRIRELESDVHDLQHRLERSQEEHRTIIIERDQFRDDLDNERHKAHDGDHRHRGLQDNLSKAESSLIEVRAEVSSANERIKLIERERDEHRDKNSQLHHEITSLREKLTLLQAEIKTLIGHRDRAHKELEDYRRRYEEVTETITEYENGGGELEFEIESLRTMLRESREQKERAISARATADRERDEALAKYEDKCREMERWEENRSSYLHAHHHSSSSATRTVTRNVDVRPSSRLSRRGSIKDYFFSKLRRRV